MAAPPGQFISLEAIDTLKGILLGYIPQADKGNLKLLEYRKQLCVNGYSSWDLTRRPWFRPHIWQVYHLSPASYLCRNSNTHVGKATARYASKGFAPESKGTYITYMPLLSANKPSHYGFETHRRRHQKSKTGVSVVP